MTGRKQWDSGLPVSPVKGTQLSNNPTSFQLALTSDNFHYLTVASLAEDQAFNT